MVSTILFTWANNIYFEHLVKSQACGEGTVATCLHEIVAVNVLVEWSTYSAINITPVNL